MELELTATNCTTESAEAGDEAIYAAPPCIWFCGKVGKRVVLNLEPEQGATAAEWATLADACKSGATYEKNWSPGNGEMRITVRAGSRDVLFTVAKYGDGCGGDMSCCVSAASCVEAFREAARLTEAWLSAQNHEKPREVQAPP